MVSSQELTLPPNPGVAGPSELQLPAASDPQGPRHVLGQLLEDAPAIPRASAQDPMTNTQQVLNKYLLRRTWKRGRMGRGGMQAAHCPHSPAS